MRLNALKKAAADAPPTPKLPVLFVGHGNPMNAVETNRSRRAWEAMMASIARPQAILCVSAH